MGKLSVSSAARIYPKKQKSKIYRDEKSRE